MLSLALLAALHVGDGIAQTMPVLGYVAAKNVNPERFEIFKKGLTDLGYVEGKNIRIEYRDAVLDAEYHGLMADLTNRKVDIIVAANIAGAVAAAKATNTIPVVMLAVNDPVAVGVINSLEHPGTNVTGTTTYSPKLMGERLRILKSIVPNLDKVAMVLNGNNANNAAQFELLRSEARGLGIEVDDALAIAEQVDAKSRHRDPRHGLGSKPHPMTSLAVARRVAGRTRPSDFVAFTSEEAAIAAATPTALL